MKLVENNDKLDKTISEFLNCDNELLKQKGIKLTDIKEAQKKGWVGLTLNELDYDVEGIYQRLVEVIKETPEIDKDALAIINTINNIRKDKIDLLKFMSAQKLKEKELDYKYNAQKNKAKFGDAEL